MRTLRIYSQQLYLNAAVFIIFIIFFIRSLVRIYHITGSLYIFTIFIQFSFPSGTHFIFIFLIYFYFFCLFAISWAAPAACGGSQARSQIGAVATGLHQSRSNAGFKPRLWPAPQLTATPDLPTERDQGLNPQPHGS